MSSNTKIVVLRSKEIVYALVLLVVSVLIIMVAVSLFMPSKDTASPVPAQNAEETPEQTTPQTPSQTTPNTAPSTAAPDGTNQTSSTVSDTNTTAQNTYVPGIYSSTLLLGTANVELQVAVDKDHINSITLTNLDESVTTLYPLMSPTLSELSAVILSEQSIENVSYGEENRYTSMLLMQAITAALDKAAVSENADRPETGTLY
ncbi:MAG: hypothetical protein K2O40_05600 [Lachnospiraceae bacterium]|nr:hypothetical protein [Lachnospiraceae bacterium]MDE7183947.1 hypothetical protein [Lachnospiraceae bacterium]